MALREGFKIISSLEAEYKGVTIKCDAEWVKNIWGQLESRKFYLAFGRRFDTLKEIFAHVDKLQATDK